MTDITISDITNATIDTEGTGVFDVLMKSMSLQLTSQFDEGRITGTDFATVYLGGLQTVLQQSITFILNEQKASKEIELLDLDLLKKQEEIDLLQSQDLEVLAGTARANTTAGLNDQLIIEKTNSEIKNNEVDGILDKQKADIVAGTTLKISQNAEVLADTIRKDDLTAAQIRESEEKKDLTIAQTAKVYEDIDASQSGTIRANLLNNRQVLKIDEDIVASKANTSRSDTTALLNDQLIVEKTNSEVKNNELDGILDKQKADIIASTVLKTSQNAEVLANTLREDTMSAKQVLKVIEETALVDAKIASESTNQRAAGFTAQAKIDKELGYVITQDVINPWDIDNIAAGTDGFIDAQIDETLKKTLRSDNESAQKIALMAAQTTGFTTDTKQKILKQMLDGYAVNLSIAGSAPAPAATKQPGIDAVTNDILSDVGSSVTVAL